MRNDWYLYAYVERTRLGPGAWQFVKTATGPDAALLALQELVLKSMRAGAPSPALGYWPGVGQCTWCEPLDDESVIVHRGKDGLLAPDLSTARDDALARAGAGTRSVYCPCRPCPGQVRGITCPASPPTEGVAPASPCAAFYAQHPDMAWQMGAADGPYLVCELRLAFNAVHPPGDWKAPVDAKVKEKDAGAVCAAVAFYTATLPTVTPLAGGKVRIRAAGYRAGPAGP